MKEKKKSFPSEPYNIKDFLVGQNHQEDYPVGHQYIHQQSYFPSRSQIIDFLVS